MTPRASSLIGLVMLVLAAVVMSGWLLHSPVIVSSIPGSRMVFNTALCFALAGLALATESFLPAALQRRVRAGLGVAVASIAALVLAQDVSGGDLGIDLPALHRWLPDDNAHPGRMSQVTALAFVLTGATLVSMDRVRALWSGLAVQAATAAVFALGAIGLAGQALDLPLIYPDYAFRQMALHSAAGFIAASAALGFAWQRMEWYVARTLIRSEEQRITLTGAAVLALIVCVSVLSGFAILSRQLQAAAQTGLLESLKSRIDLLRITLEYRSARATVVATRPTVSAQLAALQERSSDATALDRLNAEAESALPLGFSAVAFFGPHGEPRGGAWSPIKQPALALPIDGMRSSMLLWDDGFVLHQRMIVKRDGEPVGEIVTEQRLAELTEAFRASDDFAASAEIVMCRRNQAELDCVRHHPQPPVFHVAYSRSLPIARAFEGATGVVVGRDYRGQFVLAAHGPVAQTGLAMVLKIDTAELYAPVRKQMYAALALLVVMTALGAGLLRQRIAPLVRRLAANEERLALALEGSRLALWDLDVRAGRVWLDERWQEMMGGPPGPTATTLARLEGLVHPEDLPALREHLAEVFKGIASHYDIEHRVKRASGEWLWIRSRGRVVQRDANGRPLRLAGTNANIDRRKQAELELAHRAAHDALTGLPNRNLFRDRLERAVARSRRNRTPMAVMYLDIDKFKGVNDTFGHDTGDALIRAFAHRLVECIRSTDTAARLGGDEFAVILEALHDRDAGRKIAAKIVAAMRREFELGARTLAVSTSVGMAFYAGEDDRGADAIVKRADEALYEAKAAGRDTYRVSGEAGA